MDTLMVARRNQGFVLVVTLLVLVIITLASVAMMSLLRTGITASGNIAFRQAASRTADIAVDNAFQWVSTQINANVASLNTSGAVAATATTSGSRYYAINYDVDVACTKTGTTTFTPQTYRFGDANGVIPNGNDGFPCAARLPSTPSGYYLYYVVHRMANAAGSCPGAGCMAPVFTPTGTTAGCSMDPSDPAYCGVNNTTNSLVYYRITVKVVGPRQNNRYIQTFIY
jgi:type IV pilus assembly protein PilX